jgi:Sec-independent protein translocase protein TatA
VGFGTEILFVLVLGLLVLGPKRLYTMLGHVARAKAQFEAASRGFKSQLSADLEAVPREVNENGSHELVEDQ